MNSKQIIDSIIHSEDGPHNRGLTVRGLLDKLEALPSETHDSSLSVMSECITDIGVYRDHNSDLALYYERDMNYPENPFFIASGPMSISNIIDELNEIIGGKEMNTYKCGPTTIKETANVWVTVYKECHGFYITDIVYEKLSGGQCVVGAVLENIPHSVMMCRGINKATAMVEQLKQVDD